MERENGKLHQFIKIIMHNSIKVINKEVSAR